MADIGTGQDTENKDARDTYFLQMLEAAPGQDIETMRASEGTYLLKRAESRDDQDTPKKKQNYRGAFTN